MRLLDFVRGCLVVGGGCVMLVSSLGLFGYAEPPEDKRPTWILGSCVMIWLGLMMMVAHRWRPPDEGREESDREEFF